MSNTPSAIEERLREYMRRYEETPEMGTVYAALTADDQYALAKAFLARSQSRPSLPDMTESGWTVEQALRFYSQGRHFDVVDGHTRILDTGAVASDALKGMSHEYAERKGCVASSTAPNMEVIDRALTQFAQCISVLAGDDKTRADLMVEESRPILRDALNTMRVHFAASAIAQTLPEKLPALAALAALADHFGLSLAESETPSSCAMNIILRTRSAIGECQGYSKGHATDRCGNCGKLREEHVHARPYPGVKVGDTYCKSCGSDNNAANSRCFICGSGQLAILRSTDRTKV